MEEIVIGKEDRKRLEERLRLFKHAYEKEQRLAYKSSLMEEIIRLEQRLEEKVDPSKNTDNKLEPVTKTILNQNKSKALVNRETPITHGEKVSLAQQIRSILPNEKIKAKKITLETHGQYAWAIQKLKNGNKLEVVKVSWWCMKKKLKSAEEISAMPLPKNTDNIKPPKANKWTKKPKWTFEENDLLVPEGFKGIFVDAGTSHNGQKGLQKTTIAAFDSSNNLIFEEMIGDKTNNEGEISVIIRVLDMSMKLKQPFKIFSDSQIALGWVYAGKTKDRKLINQAELARKANELLRESGCKLQWIPRDYNKAGHYLEEKYKI